MPNNIDTVKADESKLLELQVLPPDDFTDHASVCEFVRSKEFRNYAGITSRLPYSEVPLSREDDFAARSVAESIIWDLTELAQFAAGPERPLIVQDLGDDRRNIIHDLGVLGRASCIGEGFPPADLYRQLHKLMNYHQQLVDAGDPWSGMSAFSH